MYPSLMAAGGLITLAWDNRHHIIIPLTSRLPSQRSSLAHRNAVQAQPDVQEDQDAIELSDRSARSPSQPTDKSVNDAPNIVSTGIHNAANDPSSHLSEASQSHPSSSGIHQRPISNIRHLGSSAEQERPDIGEEAPLLTLGTKPALAMALTFVALVIIFVVMKAKVNSLGRPFDVS
jgi:hypothetical protein